MALRHSLSQKSKIFSSSLKEGAEGAAAPSQPPICPINPKLFQKKPEMRLHLRLIFYCKNGCRVSFTWAIRPAAKGLSSPASSKNARK